MFRVLVAALALSTVPAVPTVPADASSVQYTAIDGFAASVSTVAYQQPVTFTGQLVAGGVQTPVPDEPVQIQLNGPAQTFVTIATGATGSDGRFTITTTLPSGGSVRAFFAGDTGLAFSYSSQSFLTSTSLPSRLVLDPVPKSVPAGTPVVFSGTLQVQVDGAWQPFQGVAPLSVVMEPYTSSQPDVTHSISTGADGRFSLTEPLSETSDWYVETLLDGACWGNWLYDCARAYYGWTYGVSKTRVTGFSVPAAMEAHHASTALYGSGTVERWNGGAWVGLAYGQLQFYYRPKGSAIWHRDRSAGQAAASGRFRVPLSIHLGTGYWRVRVQPAVDVLTSISAGTVASTITDRTHFTSMYIQRYPTGSTIGGQVTDMFGGMSFSSLRGLTLRLLDRRASSSTWHAYEMVKAGSDGYFHFFATRGYGYDFKVVLPAQGPFLSSTSRTL